MPKAKNKKVNKDVTIYQQSLTIADMRMERQYYYTALKESQNSLVEQQRVLEQTNKDLYDAFRAYDGLNTMANAAEKMGVDMDNLHKKLPENIPTNETHDFKQSSVLTESGKVNHSFKLTPKKKGGGK